MPTGITQPIYENKNISFEEFVWRCARQMMPLIHMRDDDLDAKICLPQSEQGSSYAQRELEKAKLDVKVYEGYDETAWKTFANNAYKEELDQYIVGKRREEMLAARYKAMIVQVEAWEPPTSQHEGLKEFMLKQLRESLEHDTGTYNRYVKRPGPKDWQVFRDAKLARARSNVAYYEEQLAKEQARNTYCKHWITSLDETVRVPDPLRGEGL